MNMAGVLFGGAKGRFARGFAVAVFLVGAPVHIPVHGPAPVHAPAHAPAPALTAVLAPEPATPGFGWNAAKAAQTEVRAVRVGPTLSHPWGMDFIGDGSVLVTERAGGLHRIDLASGASRRIAGLPKVYARNQGGLLDVAVHDGWVYLCYSADTRRGAATAIDRARLAGDRLVERSTIFVSNSGGRGGRHFGCRIVFADGYLHASLGDRGKRENAQRHDLHTGAIIRLAPDGAPAPGNPALPGWAPEIYSTGHRNAQGMAVDPATGALWANEHGPRGGDEINIIRAGANYGWPEVSHGREYASRRRVSRHESLPGFEDPVWVWTPSIAPSGLAFYPEGGSDVPFPAWRGHVLVGSLKFRELYLVERDAGGMPIRERVVLDGDVGRVRDVAVATMPGFEGQVYVLSDEAGGGLWRLVPR